MKVKSESEVAQSSPTLSDPMDGSPPGSSVHGFFQVVQWYRIHVPVQETRVQSLGQEGPLEKEMATHRSILAWRIPWTEEPDGL